MYIMNISFHISALSGSTHLQGQGKCNPGLKYGSETTYLPREINFTSN